MRIYQHGKKRMWYIDVREKGGKRSRRTLGTTDEKLARAKAAQLERDFYLEEHFQKIPEYAFKEGLLKYGLERHRANPKDYDACLKWRLQRFLDEFGKLSVAEITYQRIEDYAFQRRESVSDATLERELSVLKAILNRAYKAGRLVKCPNFPKIRKQKGRDRFLSYDEEMRLLEAAPKHLRRIIVFAIDTGSRKSEVLSLDWQHVSLERRAVKFTDTKNGEDRTVPISDRVFEMLADMDCRSEGPVFTYHGKVIMSVGTSFSNACIKAKIDDFRFHDLRHTFASRLVQADVALYKVMNLTGHKSYAMVQRYAHLAPDYQRDAIAAMEALGQQKGTRSESAQRATQPSG